MRSILIAGIGNIFLGDDGFGCEVVRELLSREWPPGVAIKDFGIRSYDLAYALVEDYDAIVLVDAAPRGGSPGTTYAIEIEPGELQQLAGATPDAHVMNPVSALQMAQSVGSVRAKLYLVGCEPARLEPNDGEFSLSEPVRQAVPEALNLVERLVREQLGPETKTQNMEVLA
jgi:hydrogenase maturation protease